jgi:uncharacterized protein YuzE
MYKYTLEKECDICMFYLRTSMEKIDHTDTIHNDDVILDYTTENSIVGIEILDFGIESLKDIELKVLRNIITVGPKYGIHVTTISTDDNRVILKKNDKGKIIGFMIEKPRYII